LKILYNLKPQEAKYDFAIVTDDITIKKRYYLYFTTILLVKISILTKYYFLLNLLLKQYHYV